MPVLTLEVLAGDYAVCRLPPGSPAPAWPDRSPFASITRTPDELSVVCLTDRVPDGVRAERGWRLVRFRGPFALDATGILASVAGPLAGAGVSLLALGTFDTDYVLVKAAQLETATRALRAAGHVVVEVPAP